MNFVLQTIISKRRNINNLLIVIFGESNSGGIALNSDATTNEIDETSSIKIWDNINNDGFENLNIGTNNLLGHAGLESYVNNSHGWELELSNQAENNQFNSVDSLVYLVKCGQGGTKITNWVDGVLYAGINPWNILQTRVNGAIGEIQSINQNPISIYVLFSLGINDAMVATDPTIFRTKTQTLISNFRTLYNQYNNGGEVIKFYATEIMDNNANYIAINNEILTIAADDSNFTAIQTSDAAQRDSNHWSYSGMKLIAQRMLTLIKADFN